MIPKDELDRIALVKRQAELISREGFPELGYSVLQQGYRRISQQPASWFPAVDAMWREAIQDHCESFGLVELMTEAQASGVY